MSIKKELKELFHDVKKIWYDRKRLKTFLKKLKSNNSRKILLLGGPEYNNLGDHAIAFATEYFVKENFKSELYFEFTESEVRRLLWMIKKIVNPNDIILLQGGGNMGDLYPDQEIIRRKVINIFPSNKIIIMPQTIFFQNSENKIPEYYRRPNISIFAREEKTYELLKSNNFTNAYLCPDIVMYLIGNYNIKKYKKQHNNKALICIRNDKEKHSNRKSYEELENMLNNNFKKIESISTVLKCDVYIQARFLKLEELLEKIGNSELFITDRLHGMILSTLVNTFCIVLPTFNYKVTSSYIWLKNNSFVSLINKENDLLNNFLSIKEKKHSTFCIKKFFSKLKKEME